MVAYGSRDPMAYGVTRAMEEFFVKSSYSGMDAFDNVSLKRAISSFKVTVQFETEGNGQIRFLVVWIDQKYSFKIAKKLL